VAILSLQPILHLNPKGPETGKEPIFLPEDGDITYFYLCSGNPEKKFHPAIPYRVFQTEIPWRECVMWRPDMTDGASKLFRLNVNWQNITLQITGTNLKVFSLTHTGTI
jgi:hypothetical protein